MANEGGSEITLTQFHFEQRNAIVSCENMQIVSRFSDNVGVGFGCPKRMIPHTVLAHSLFNAAARQTGAADAWASSMFLAAEEHFRAEH